jgi:hypothetical protein
MRGTVRASSGAVKVEFETRDADAPAIHFAVPSTAPASPAPMVPQRRGAPAAPPFGFGNAHTS